MIRIGALDRKFGAPTSRVSEFTAKVTSRRVSSKTPAERGRASSRLCVHLARRRGAPGGGLFLGDF